MKKIIVLALAVLMAFGVCACGESETATTAAQSTAASDGFVFTYNGKTIALHEKMEDVLADIGKEKSYFESESCAFKGLDKQYTYDNFVIYTYPVDDVDYVLQIALTSDLVQTTEGITIGSTAEQVEAAYKNDTFGTIGSTGRQYTRGQSRLLFVLDDEGEKVQSVQYYAITD